MTDPLGPKNLGQAFGYIQQQIEQRKAKSNGHASPTANRICDVCSKLYYHKQVIHSPDLITKRCAECDKEISNGMIAVRTIGGRYCFVSHPDLAEHGPILEVSEEIFNELERQAKEIEKQNEGDGTKNGE